MKTRTTASARTLPAALFILLTAPLLTASAQSGRVVPTPQPSPTPTPQAAPPNRPDAGPAFVVQAGADKYKLVFATNYEGKLYFVRDKEQDESNRTRRSKFDNFIEHLNRAGEQGYRLTSVVAGAPLAVIVKLDKVQYEYEWFETTNNRFYAMGGFESRYAELSKRGFRLVDHALLSMFCESADPESTAWGEACESRHLFLVEREKGAGETTRFAIADTTPGLRKKIGEALTIRVNNRLIDGLYPTRVFSKYEVLLEPAEEAGELSAGRPDVRVVTSGWRDDLREKVNELAKQGYRLAMTHNGIAVMHRRGADATPVTYVWLKAKDKDFEKQLARLQESGAVYRMTYPDSDGDEDKLVFEQGMADDGRRREYKVLRLEFDEVENAAEKRVRIDLTPSSIEAMRMVNRLAKEGFAVRDLFVSTGAGVLLERSL